MILLQTLRWDWEQVLCFKSTKRCLLARSNFSPCVLGFFYLLFVRLTAGKKPLLRRLEKKRKLIAA